jgi:hypothetical protein
MVQLVRRIGFTSQLEEWIVIEWIELGLPVDGTFVMLRVEERERISSFRFDFDCILLVRGRGFPLYLPGFQNGSGRRLPVECPVTVSNCIFAPTFQMVLDQVPAGPELSVLLEEYGIFTFSPSIVDEYRADIVGPSLAALPGRPSWKPSCHKPPVRAALHVYGFR